MLKADIGDAFRIEVKEGESFTMVVDGGSKRSMRTVVPAIEALEKIDMLVLTHYDVAFFGDLSLCKNSEFDVPSAMSILKSMGETAASSDETLRLFASS